MKNYLIFALLILLSGISFAGDDKRSLNLTCQDYSWSDVEALVEPYLDEVLYTALVMQGQSDNYKTSLAASQALDKSLPEAVQRILQALIDADC